MQVTKTDDTKRWKYEVAGSTYYISITEELEDFLLREHYEPQGARITGIQKLKGIPIEKILEKIIKDEYNNYDLKSEDQTHFKMAIQEIQKEAS